jgi:hypothetical protein
LSSIKVASLGVSGLPFDVSLSTSNRSRMQYSIGFPIPNEELLLH